MDLALQTGWPLRVIATMPERELRMWDGYAQQKGFPFRRLEYGLARICTMIAGACGVKDPQLSDYLFDIPDDSEMTDEDLADMKAEIGFNPD